MNMALVSTAGRDWAESAARGGRGSVVCVT